MRHSYHAFIRLLDILQISGLFLDEASDPFHDEVLDPFPDKVSDVDILVSKFRIAELTQLHNNMVRLTADC